MVQPKVRTSVFLDDLSWGALRYFVNLADEAGVDDDAEVEVQYLPDDSTVAIALVLQVQPGTLRHGGSIPSSS